MTITSRILRAGLLALCAIVVLAAGGLSYLYWTDASIGLSGSGRGIVVEYVDTERRWQRIETQQAQAAVAAAHPTRQDLSGTGTLAKPEPQGAEQPGTANNYWTDYRGPRRDGSYTQMPLDLTWSAQGPPEIWRREVGGGYASMVVADALVYTIEQRRETEAVTAYRLEDGRQAWEYSWPSRFSESMGGDGPRATPTWSDGHLYALGANGRLVCLAATDGKLIWERNILDDAGAENLTWGMAGAPLVVDGMVIVHPGGRNGKSVFAYDRATGEVRWSALDDKAGYVAPQIATLAGRRQILLVTGTRVLGASIEDGSELWSVDWETSYDANCAQPLVVDGEHVFVSSGYGHGAALLRIAASDGRFVADQVWFNLNMKNKFNPSVLADGVVYGLDEGILAAVDVLTGKRLWKQGRYRYGQLLHASGHLIVISEEGELALVEATPDQYREIARFESIAGKTWNVPAIANGILLVRNQTEMAAYDLR